MLPHLLAFFCEAAQAQSALSQAAICLEERGVSSQSWLQVGRRSYVDALDSEAARESSPGHAGQLANSSAAQRAVAAAAIGLHLNTTTPLRNKSGQSEAPLPIKVGNATLGNATLQDMIKRAEEDTLTNLTIARKAAEALKRKKRGRKTPTEEKFDATVAGGAANETIADELNNETVQKVIRERVEEAVDEEVLRKVNLEHRLPSQRELNRTVADELRHIWRDLMYAHRRRGHLKGVTLWKSVAFFDWCLLLSALVAFVIIQLLLRDRPTTRACQRAALPIWLCMAVVYYVLIHLRLGVRPALHWLVGYLLELIFSIENVFVFHIIVKAFRMPRWVTQKVLFIVVVLQLGFQVVFYMGLGKWLQSWRVLPYLLGVWLIYLGCQTVLEEEKEDVDIMQTRAVSTVRRLLGDRLVMDRGGGDLLASEDEKMRLRLPGLMLLCLLAADFLLEVDVTVLKIEEFRNAYICLSSSMVASFAVPELFFLARDLFHRFFALKYGVSFVLVFVGVQSLLHDLFSMSALTSLAIIVGVMLSSVLVSVLFRREGGSVGAEGPVGAEDPGGPKAAG